jgi:hypothetical protein
MYDPWDYHDPPPPPPPPSPQHQAYQNLFKHIRSVSHAVYSTAQDSTDPEMGSGEAFRRHFKGMLSQYRQQEVRVYVCVCVCVYVCVRVCI